MDRRYFIGGSDCVQIMYGDWLELWLVKTGRKQSEDLSENLPVQLGIFTEEFNLNWFKKQYKDCVLTNEQTSIEKDIEGVPCKGTVDAMYNNYIVEAKHTNPFNKMADVIERYMPQLQMYCHLSGQDGIYLSVIFGNSDYKSVFIDYNAKYFTTMMKHVKKFWDYVEQDKQPRIDDEVSEIDCNVESIPVDKLIIRNAEKDNEFTSLSIDYHTHYHSYKNFEQIKKDLKKIIKPTEREVYNEYLSVRKNKRGAISIVRTKTDGK